MHFKSNTMSAKLRNYEIAVFVTRLHYSISHVTNTNSHFTFIQSNIERFLCNTQQALHLWTNFSHRKSVSRVANISIEFNYTVHRHIVALIKEEVSRNPVNHYVVDRYAESCRKSFKALTQRNTSIVANKLFTNLIEKCSSNTRTHMAAHLSKRTTHEESAFAYKFNFFLCFKQYHVLKRYLKVMPE